MKAETRLKIALHHTLLTCVNFKDKDVDKLYLMLQQWDAVPGMPPGGIYKPLNELFQVTFPTTDHLLDFLILVNRQYINPGSFSTLDDIRKYLKRLYGETLVGMVQVEQLLEKISRTDKPAKENYCWDSRTILLDKPAYKSEIGWLLLGPSVRLRQGQLSKEAMHRRIDAVMGVSDGTNT